MDRRVTPSKQVPRLPGVPHLHVNRPFKRHFILASFMLNFITETWPYVYGIQGFLNNWVSSYLYDRYQTQRLRLAQTLLRKSDVCTRFRNLIVPVVSELEKQFSFNLFTNDTNLLYA